MGDVREGKPPAPEGNVMTITANARAAANRARTLADVIRDRAAMHPAQNNLLAITKHLTDAAHSFETEPAPVIGGITITNTFPADACLALWDAQAIAADDRRIAHLEDAIDHVTGPAPELQALHPESPQLARQESGLRTRIALAAHDLDQANHATTVHAALATLVGLYQEFTRLTAAVAVDNNRPCNRR
ncbi:hypothetical protein OHA04_27545 [Streptomyces sp. NBC_01590]|uniref:hypothetical protein n=1 Tax=Streptomyces sp. NBC_01590 TaxID=2975887 RepID=UPI00386C1465